MMRQRVLFLDLVRIIAAAMVVMIHVSGWFTRIPPDMEDVSSWDTVAWGAMSACAVPLFFMISGALMLNSDYAFDIRKILLKIGKIIVILLAWGALYALADMKTFSLEKLLIWTYKGHFHFWFFEYLIGVYLLFPLLRALVEYRDGKYVRYFLLCWLLLGLVRITLNGIPWHNEEIRILTGKVNYELCGFSGYFVLGYYLRHHFEKIRTWMWVLLLGFSVILQNLILSFYPLQVGTYSFTIAILLEATSVFMIVKGVSSAWLSKQSRWLVELSGITLGIYLIHPFVLEHLTPECIWTLPLFCRVPLVFCYVFAISAACSYLLAKIPFCKKWLLSV